MASNDFISRKETIRQKKDQEVRFLKAKKNREKQIEIEINEDPEDDEDEADGNINSMFGQLNDSDDDIFGQSGADLNNLVAAQQDLAIMQKRSSRAVDT